MHAGIPERDWKVFRDLYEKALDRFCHRALDEIATLCTGADDERTNHQRYAAVYGRLREINKDMSAAFDRFARSKALMQIAIMRNMGLWTDEELARFSEDTLERTKPRPLDEEE
ncbi:hypothetical protein KBTX_04309 [wastewater metagenome]|uniref:Uncharacterized protein n=2 Tax=unclassified sequences TaxID=12908 RepID=A0A5B8RIS0_9ZZZZ|nr:MULTISPECIES: hypothetical protein [Arhodomonas]MCS4502521.1 hypothetical protein [Arhodomonas aquaeolei]QEA07943.1 hypothetical protein KBTEX_04309 [uncultured organism]